MFTTSLPYWSRSSLSRVRKLVPAKLASIPSTRSSSIGWPHDSWTWSAICDESMITVISPLGHSGAVSSATASSAMRSPWSGSAMALMASKPPVTCWPPEELG